MAELKSFGQLDFSKNLFSKTSVKNGGKPQVGTSSIAQRIKLASVEDATWQFVETQEEYEIKGLNDSGVETFNDDCLKGLARESCQNSLDARNPSASTDQPIIIEFHRFSTGSESFPRREEFLDSLDRALQFWRIRNDKKTIEFIENAICALKSPKLEWLRISDFNTTGLQGVAINSADKTTPWSSLVMSSGVSPKDGITGGSFGIGKFASFSCSSLRTCFYSTYTNENEIGHQGVARLLSFKTANGKIALGNGYYRGKTSTPCAGSLGLPKGYERFADAYGTDILIPAFMSSSSNSSWVNEVASAIVDGFFYAIFEKKLEAHLIDDLTNTKVIINRNWLETKDFTGGDKCDIKTPEFYRALTTRDKDTCFYEDIPGEGRLELKLVCAPNLCRRIAMIRETGMMIFAKGNFPRIYSFAGVLIVHGENLNNRIKKFENPQHNNWEEKRNRCDKKILTHIYDFCRRSLEQLMESFKGEELDAGLGHLLPATGDIGEQEKRETLTPRIADLSPQKKKRRKVVRKASSSEEGDVPVVDDPDTGEDGGAGGLNSKRSNSANTGLHPSGTSPGDGNGPGEGDKNQLKLKSIQAGKIRFACTDYNRGEYRLLIYPSTTKEKGAIKLNAVAELDTYEAEIISATLVGGMPLSVSGNLITGLAFKKNMPLQVHLVLNYDDYVSLEAEWYGLN